MSASQRDEMALEAIEDYGRHIEDEFPGVVLPGVKIVSYVNPREGLATQADCISKLGFPATPTKDQGIVFGDIPDDQAEAQSVAVYTCRAQYPIDPKYMQPLNRSQLDYLYYYSQHDLTQCIKTQGFSVPKLPTRAAFAAIVAGKSAEAWDPFQEVEATANYDQLMDITEKCPQYPPATWGD